MQDVFIKLFILSDAWCRTVKVVTLSTEGFISVWFLSFHFTPIGIFIFVSEEPVHFQLSFGESEVYISLSDSSLFSQDCKCCHFNKLKDDLKYL